MMHKFIESCIQSFTSQVKVYWKLHWNFHFSSESLLKVSLKFSLWLCKSIESFTRIFISFYILSKFSIWQWKFHWNFEQTCNLRVKVSLKLSTNFHLRSESFSATFNKVAPSIKNKTYSEQYFRQNRTSFDHTSARFILWFSIFQSLE